MKFIFRVMPLVALAVLLSVGYSTGEAVRADASCGASERVSDVEDAVEAVDTVAAGENQLTASDVFVGLSSEALELLPLQTRQDMLIYHEAGREWKATNAMEGLSELLCVTDDFLEVRLTGVSTFQIRILPLKKKGKYVAMTIYTVGTDKESADSEVRFYDESLAELDGSKYLKTPQLKEFLTLPKKGLTLREAEELVPFTTVAFSASADSDQLSAQLTIGDYLSVESYDTIKPYITNPLTYRWAGDRFRLEK